MFQPQPTPYANFLPYGAGAGAGNGGTPTSSYPTYQYQQQAAPGAASAGAVLDPGATGVLGGLGFGLGLGLGLGLREGSTGSGEPGPGGAGGAGGAGVAGAGGGAAGAAAAAASTRPSASGPVALPVLFTSPIFGSSTNNPNSSASILVGPGADPAVTAARFAAYNSNTNTNTNAITNTSTNTHNSKYHHPLGGHTFTLPHHYSRGRHNPKMDPGAAMHEDLAAQEAAAREYQPQLEGPLVGDKARSHVITEEYAKADPQYVRKTVALPQTYSHYRPIQGDGNCGWRAIAFSYFETLIRTGDLALLEAERVRIIRTPIIGHDEFVFDDMREEVDILMKELSACLGNPPNAQAVLLQKFNDVDVANHILYYIRLLASSWFKGDPSASNYFGFIPEGLGPQNYCQEYLELPGREIEHLGLIILANALLKPVGFVLQIAYLDRSPGPKVNTYCISDEASGQDPANLGPIIHLLFRPDHYDILYRDVLPMGPVDLRVNRATSFSHRHAITNNTSNLQTFSDVDYSAIAFIPGLTSAGPGLHISVPTASPLESYSPSPQTPWMPTTYPGTGSNAVTLDYAQPSTPPVPLMVQPQPPPRRQTTTPPLRFSEYCHPSLVEADTWQHELQPSFQTPTFKNSHFNTAHYNNPNFQPEEYRPDDDEVAEASAPPPKPSGRKRSGR